MNAIKTTFFYLISLAIIVSCTDKTKSGTITQKKVIDYKELKMEGLLAYYLFEENLLTDEDSIIGRLNDSIKEYKNYNFITFEFSDSINDYIRLRFEKYQEDPYTISCIKTRNVFTYSFIDDDTILVNGDFIENSTLIYDSMITFINHPYDTSYSFNYPEFKRSSISIFGDTLISKQIFYLNCQFYSDTSVSITNWKKVKEVSKDILLAYNHVRNLASNQIWGINYDSISFEKKSAISQLHPIRILIEPNKIYMRPSPPPPPPPALQEEEFMKIKTNN